MTKAELNANHKADPEVGLADNASWLNTSRVSRWHESAELMTRIGLTDMA